MGRNLTEIEPKSNRNRSEQGGVERLGVRDYGLRTPALSHSSMVEVTSVMAWAGETSYSSQRALQRSEAVKAPFWAVSDEACSQRKAAVSLRVIILLKLMSAIDSPTKIYSLPSLRSFKPSIVRIDQ